MHPLTLGERLTLIRKRHRMTQRALAERIGCQQSDIHRLEAGLVTDPHMSRLVALARALQVSTDWLAGLEDSTDVAAPVPPVQTKVKRTRSRISAPAEAELSLEAGYLALADENREMAEETLAAAAEVLS